MADSADGYRGNHGQVVNTVSELGIPKPEEIGAAWMTRALASAGIGGGTAAVRQLAFGPIGSGQMGESYRFSLEWNGGGDGQALPATVVGKFASSDPNSREAGRMGAYVREIGFYQDLQAIVGVPTPAPYYVAFDPDTADFIILMSDLSPATQGDQLLGCDLLRATGAVEAIAGLHASTWGRADEVANFSWLPRRSLDQVGVHADRYRALFDGFVAEYSARLGTEDIELGRWLGDNYELVSTGHTLPTCVVHNDFRLDNVMFGRAGVSVVDWQTLAIGFGPVDIAYFVGAGVVPAPNDAEERSLVGRYGRRLAELGVGVEDEELWRSYRLGSASGYIMAVVASQLVVRTERGNDMFTAMASRHAQQMRRLSFTALFG